MKKKQKKYRAPSCYVFKCVPIRLLVSLSFDGEFDEDAFAGEDLNNLGWGNEYVD